MKNIGIEALLTWAFCRELCKVGSNPIDEVGGGYSHAWSIMSEVALLGTVVDRSPNVFGVIPDFIGGSEPHPDAVIVGEAVRSLVKLGGFEIGEGWTPFPEWQDEHGLIAHEVDAVVREMRLKNGGYNGKQVVNLVVTSAILGRGPNWTAEEPKAEIVSLRDKPQWFVMRRGKDAFGESYSYEADGYDRKAGRPKKGAYRKYRLSDPLRGAIIGRLEWQLWQDALLVLADWLDGRLSDHRLYAFHPNRHPWIPMRISANIAQAIDIVSQ